MKPPIAFASILFAFLVTSVAQAGYGVGNGGGAFSLRILTRLIRLLRPLLLLSPHNVATSVRRPHGSLRKERSVGVGADEVRSPRPWSGQGEAPKMK